VVERRTTGSVGVSLFSFDSLLPILLEALKRLHPEKGTTCRGFPREIERRKGVQVKGGNRKS